MKLPTDLNAFIESLNAAGVKYLIVGGYAVGFHGWPRFTGDIDFFVEPSEENARRIIEALRRFGFGSMDLSPRDFTQSGIVVQLGFPPNRIDLMTSIDGVDFSAAWKDRVAANIDQLPTNFISREHLLANKRAVGRPKDLADAGEI